MNINNYKRAFTLIEVILVLAIISMMAGLVLYLVNPTGVFEKANDAKVENDKIDIETAFIKYKLDNEGGNPFEGELVQGFFYRICKEEIEDCDILNYEVSLNELKDRRLLLAIPIHPEDSSARYTGYLIKDINGAIYDIANESEITGTAEETIVGSCFDFQSLEYCTVLGSTGTLWLDRNLGASQAAISETDPDAYGDLYQWGRSADGHQVVTSVASAGPSDQLIPGIDFLTKSTPEFNWYNGTEPDGLWQGISGINNPCPNTWRLPTQAEWQAEIDEWSIQSSIGGFSSSLKLVQSGRRGQTGTVTERGSVSYYWTSNALPSVDTAYYARVDSSSALMAVGSRVQGMSIRCIKDLDQTGEVVDTAVYNLQKNGLGECSGSLDINGNYNDGQDLGPSHTVELSVFVAAIGDYSIETNILNGYSFSKTGTFESTGNTVVTLDNDDGTPINPGVNRFTATGGGTNCTFEITVQ